MREGFTIHQDPADAPLIVIAIIAVDGMMAFDMRINPPVFEFVRKYVWNPPPSPIPSRNVSGNDVGPVGPVAPVPPMTPCNPVGPVAPDGPVGPVAPVGPLGPELP